MNEVERVEINTIIDTRILAYHQSLIDEGQVRDIGSKSSRVIYDPAICDAESVFGFDQPSTRSAMSSRMPVAIGAPLE